MGDQPNRGDSAEFDAIERLLDEDAEYLASLAQTIQREIRIQLEPSYTEGQFDIVLVQNVAR